MLRGRRPRRRGRRPDAVRNTLRPALARFQNPQTGTVTLDNTFRWVAAHR